MNTYTITAHVSTKKNHGEACEENFDYMLNGTVSGKDSKAFDIASDVTHMDVGYSVKSDHFTLVSANLVGGSNMAEMLDEYFARVHSTRWAYIGRNDVAYVMDKTEFRNFIETFGTMERESTKNGGGMKVRCRAESKKMLNWLNAMAS
jgi:hypothetical protein